jgi:hypothetical protein
MRLAGSLVTVAALACAVGVGAGIKAQQEPRPSSAAAGQAAAPAASALPAATRPVPEELADAVAHAADLPGMPLPVGTMSELMVDIIYPTSDAILYISSRTPTNDVEWNELRGKALMLAESANLLMAPMRAMPPQDQWMKDAQLMLDAGTAAFEAAKNRDVAALEELNQAVYESCLVCHFHYRPDYGKSPSP